jgi:hypothetical protein
MWVVSLKPWPHSPGKRAPSTHWTGRWVGPRVCLDILEKTTTFFPNWNLNSRSSSLKPSHYNNCAILSIIIKNDKKAPNTHKVLHDHHCVCVCVRVCVRARTYAHTHTHTHTHIDKT